MGYNPAKPMEDRITDIGPPHYEQFFPAVIKDRFELKQSLAQLIKTREVTFPNFALRLRRFQPGPPGSAAKSRVLTDDFAPVDGMLKTE